MSSTVSLENFVTSAPDLLDFVFNVQVGDWKLSHRFLKNFGLVQMCIAVLMAATLFTVGTFCPELAIDVLSKPALFTIILILISLLLLGWQAVEISSLQSPHSSVSCSLDAHFDCGHQLCRVAAINQLPVVYRGLGYWTLILTIPAFPFLLAALDWGTRTSYTTKITYASYLTVMTFLALLFSLFGILLRVHSPFTTPSSLLVKFILWTEQLQPAVRRIFTPNRRQKTEVALNENSPLFN